MSLMWKSYVWILVINAELHTNHVALPAIANNMQIATQECTSVGGCVPLWEGVSQFGWVFPNVGGCVPFWEGVPQCGKVCPSVGVCAPMWEGVLQCGGCAPVWEGVSPVCVYVRCGCPCHMYSWRTHPQVHLCVHLIAGRFSHMVKAQTSWN